MKNFRNYIKKVVFEAYISENRKMKNDNISIKLAVVALDTYGNYGKKYLFVDANEYGRVRKRVEYRLNRNLAKHFPGFTGVKVVGCDSSCMVAHWYSVNDDGSIGEYLGHTGQLEGLKPDPSFIYLV